MIDELVSEIEDLICHFMWLLFSVFQKMILQKAIAFAKHHHNNQKRITEEDYFKHPLRVMKQLENLGMPKSILCAAILHDVCEETPASIPDIIREFGEEIGIMVKLLSKEESNGNNDHNVRLQHYLEQLRKGAMKYPGVLLIKMNDQLDNIKTFFVFSPQKRQRKIQEIRILFLPFYELQASFIPIEFKPAFNILYQELIQALKREEFSIIETVAKTSTFDSQEALLKIMSHLLCLLDNLEKNEYIHFAYEQVMKRLKELELKTNQSLTTKN